MLASLTTLMTALALTASSPAATQWESDYGKALAQTRSDSRPLLIVLDNTADAKQQLDANLLNGEKANASLKSYDLCHVDVSTEYGQAVAKAFGANEFPYVAIIDKSGKEVLHRHAGSVSANAWKTMLTRHESGDLGVRVTVAKPVIDEPTQPVAVHTEPVTIGGPYLESAPTQYAAPVQPYCPSCQRNR